MEDVIILLIIILGIVIYFLPSFIAHYRKHKEFKLVFLVNLFLGFTGIGYWVALIWAILGDNKK